MKSWIRKSRRKRKLDKLIKKGKKKKLGQVKKKEK